MATILVFSWFLLTTSITEATRKTVETSTWLPTWKQDCISDIVTSFRVPNVAACQVYLDSCPECCTAGFEAEIGLCHLLKASPLEAIRTPISPCPCSSVCGAYKPVQLRTKVVCPVLPSLPNGFVWYPKSRLAQHQAIFSCYLGYNLTGNDTLTCQANGSWSEQPPTCTEILCPLLLHPANGTVTYSGPRFYQYLAIFSCNQGYNLTGAGTLTCQANGNWNEEAPACEILCAVLPDPWKGNVSYPNGWRYLEHAIFQCNPGYNMTGLNNLTCLVNSSWSGDAPLCTDLETRSSIRLGPGNNTTPVVVAGDWIVVQDRGRNITNFHQSYQAYANGFGNILEDFWWGLENVHLLTSTRNYTLRVELEMFDTGSLFFQDYANFRVTSATNGYRIYVSGSNGTAGDGLIVLSGTKFSTYDNDNDKASLNCANVFRSGWWFTNCFSATLNTPGSNLNGVMQSCKSTGHNGRTCMVWFPLEPNRNIYSEGLRRCRMMVKLA